MSALTDRIFSLRRRGVTSPQEIANVVGLTPTQVTDRLKDPSLPDPASSTGEVDTPGGVLMGEPEQWSDRDLARYDADQGKFVPTAPGALDALDALMEGGGGGLKTARLYKTYVRPSNHPTATANEKMTVGGGVPWAESDVIYDELGLLIQPAAFGANNSAIGVAEEGVYLVNFSIDGIDPGVIETKIITARMNLGGFHAEGVSGDFEAGASAIAAVQHAGQGGLTISGFLDCRYALENAYGPSFAGIAGYILTMNILVSQLDGGGTAGQVGDGLLDGHSLFGVGMSIAQLA